MNTPIHRKPQTHWKSFHYIEPVFELGLLRNYHHISLVDDDLMYVRFENFKPNRAEFQQYLDDFHQAIAENPGRAQILDGSNGIWLPSEIQLMQGSWIKENQQFLLDHCTYSIFIIPNRISRMVMMGIFVVQKPKVPYSIVQSYEEAIREVRRKISTLTN